MPLPTYNLLELGNMPSASTGWRSSRTRSIGWPVFRGGGAIAASVSFYRALSRSSTVR